MLFIFNSSTHHVIVLTLLHPIKMIYCEIDITLKLCRHIVLISRLSFLNIGLKYSIIAEMKRHSIAANCATIFKTSDACSIYLYFLILLFFLLIFPYLS